MTTTTMSYYPFSFLRLMLIMLIIVFAAVSMHALIKHSQNAIIASQCADNPDLRMINSQTGRVAFVCMTENGWGIAIFEADGQPVTSFLREKAK